MFVSHQDDIPKKALSSPVLKNAFKQVLVGTDQGWNDYVMRMFTLEDHGFTPRHSHDWQHIIYFTEGEGLIHIDGTDYPVRSGSVAYVPGGREHQIKSTGSGNLVFICIVPKHGDV